MAGEAGGQRGWHSKGPGREGAKVERARTAFWLKRAQVRSDLQKLVCLTGRGALRTRLGSNPNSAISWL